MYWPIIYNYKPNIIIIGSTYECGLFEINDTRENKWKNYCFNDYKSINEVFGTIVNTQSIDGRLLLSQ